MQCLDENTKKKYESFFARNNEILSDEPNVKITHIQFSFFHYLDMETVE